MAWLLSIIHGVLILSHFSVSALYAFVREHLVDPRESFYLCKFYVSNEKLST